MIEKLGIKFYSSKDIAEMLEIKEGTARNLIRRKDIPRNRIGRRYYVTEKVLRDFLTGNLPTTKPSPNKKP